MISIKRHIERGGAVLLEAALNSYRSTLGAIGESGAQACPAVGGTLRDNLQALQAALSTESSSDQLRETGRKVEAELAQWGSGAADYFQQRTNEIKELMLILARTVEITGDRDQRYSGRLNEFTGQLRSIAGLHDLTQVRASLMKSAIDLKSCVEAMIEESNRSLEQLRKDVSVYQARLDDAERLASCDPLTGLVNRRRVEWAIESRLGQNRPFSVLIIDLNGFKKVNDTYGHLTADELLKLFAAELKSAFSASDVVGRWGGDEFVVVADGDLKTAKGHGERIARWVFGEYSLPNGQSQLKISVTGAVGAAEVQPGDTVSTLLERADAAMYREKRSLAGVT